MFLYHFKSTLTHQYHRGGILSTNKIVLFGACAVYCIGSTFSLGMYYVREFWIS